MKTRLLTSTVDLCGIMHKGNCLGEKGKVVFIIERRGAKTGTCAHY